MLSSSLLYLSLLLAKELVVSAASVPISMRHAMQIQPPQCNAAMISPQTAFAVAKPKAQLTKDYYRPPTTYETYGKGIDVPSSFMGGNLQETAVTIVQNKLGLVDGEVAFNSGYAAETAEYAYLKQTHSGIPFVNAVANVVLKDSKIVSLGSSFVRTNNIASSHPSVHESEAIHAAESAFPGTHNGHPVKLEYFAKEDGSVSLVHSIQIQDFDADVFFEVYIDAHTAEVVSATNFVAEAGYTVVPITKQNVLQGLSHITDPQDMTASSLGWHNEGTGDRKDTSGNNAVAFADGWTTAQSEETRVFKYEYNTNQDPKAGANRNAAVVNGFYIANTVHDFTYRYGFTEAAFNFQTNNFNKGGSGNDRVMVWAQNSEEWNNARFITPPDGQSGIAKMYLFNKSNPNRDGDMENSVVVHEMGHGISTRMTGGGTARCLNGLEPQGLGEGWSDALSEWVAQTSATVNDFVSGTYVLNNAAGIRRYPYSTSATTNPLRYRDLNYAQEEHAAGEIWANMLHIVYADLVKKYGFSATAKTNPGGAEGNIVFLHLFIDSFAIQPCNPTFANARDAWIQADQNRYKGANKCLLWKVFASRGLGMDAKTTRPWADGSAVPADCK